MTKPTPTAETPPHLRQPVLQAMLQTLLLAEMSSPHRIKRLRRVKSSAAKAMKQTKDDNMIKALKTIYVLTECYAEALEEVGRVAADLGKCLGRMVK